MTLARLLDASIGILFVLSALLKAVDASAFSVQIAHYKIVHSPEWIGAMAYSVISLETALGILMICDTRNRLRLRSVATLLLIAFSVLLAYSWRYHGLADCGCFGKFIKMTPMQSIAKNFALLLGIAVASLAERRSRRYLPDRACGSPEQGVLRRRSVWSATLLGAVAVGAIAACVHPPTVRPSRQPSQALASDAERPFSQFTVPTNTEPMRLGKGDYLVAFLSTTCEHCQQATQETLNDLALLPEVPRVVGLMLGDEGSLEQFRSETSATFPLVLIDPLVFFQFIGQAPPRLVRVHDGKRVQSWDEPLPNLATLLESLVAGPDSSQTGKERNSP